MSIAKCELLNDCARVDCCKWLLFWCAPQRTKLLSNKKAKSDRKKKIIKAPNDHKRFRPPLHLLTKACFII